MERIPTAKADRHKYMSLNLTITFPSRFYDSDQSHYLPFYIFSDKPAIVDRSPGAFKIIVSNIREGNDRCRAGGGVFTI
jgi:hypothetical protein